MENNKFSIESLQQLADYISKNTESDVITRPSLEKIIRENPEEIIKLLSPIIETSNASDNPDSLMTSVWSLLYEQEHIFTNMNADFQLIRDVVTSPKNFNLLDEKTSKSELVDSRGVLRGVAEVRFNDEPSVQDTFDPVWLSLVEQTLSSLDELTADLFDLISYLWLVSEKNEYGYMEFESDYALRLRFEDPMAEDFKIRERERFSIMRRVAALTSIWISMRDDNVTLINSEDIDSKNYDFQSFTRMFDIDSLKMAYDRQTGEAKGIYSLHIRPTPVIERYLTNSKQTYGPLDMKVFKYHHVTHREHKRLTRFLNYQWKIRTVQRTVSRPFKVETLVNVMNFAARNKLNARMERFRVVLNDLITDGVIKEWHYEQDFDETAILKRGGSKIWLSQNVYITPSDAINVLNKEKVLLDKVKDSFITLDTPDSKGQSEQISFSFEIESKEVLHENKNDFEQSNLSSSQRVAIISAYMQANNISLREVGAKSGISIATLMRYLNGTVKKMKPATLSLLYGWYELETKKGAD